MKEDDKSETSESSGAGHSVMGTFMADLANSQTSAHCKKPTAFAPTPSSGSAANADTADTGQSNDLLDAVFADKPTVAVPQTGDVEMSPEPDSQAIVQKDFPEAQPRVSARQEFAKATLFSTSKVPLIVYGTIGLALFGCGQFPTVFAEMLFTPDELLELPGFILNNLPTVFGGFFYLLALGAIFLGIKESFTGKLNVFEDYLAFKGKLFKTDKMHYADLRSIVIHRSPYSAFGDIGHLEVMGKSREFIFKNVAKPFELKEILIERKNKFLNNQ
jgi:hypothetical protein